ncbi:MAG: Na+/H+ antiporter NhaA, partial [Thermomicrobiaceae bacterium]|nr:Na+/H+ antiporter NhaA [Thermomicrobiaceae bacterium]
IYLTLNMGTPASRGWGIPMATDIAFALGVLALLGARVPVGLKVFLTALAIVDDLIAVLVIALFYTSNLSWPHLLAALGALLLLVAVNQAHVRSLAVYLLLGVGLWVALLNSGVHATIAGVLVAMTIPARTRLDTKQFMQRTAASLKAFQEANASVSAGLTGPAHQAALQDLTTAAEQVQSPMQRLEHALHPWTAYVIVPIFALANAGVTLGESALQSLTSAVGLGIALGLVVGKQVGITLGAWAMVRVGLAALPEGVTWRHLYGVSWLGGIGFTMSLFIADLAFSNESVIAMAKVGILSASLVAGCTGWLLLRGLPSRLEPS